MTPWTVVHQAPLSMGFPRQEYWSGLPFPSPIISLSIKYSYIINPVCPKFPLLKKKKKTKILLQGPTQEHTLYLVVTCLCLLWFGIIPQLVFVYCDLDFFNQQGPAVQNRELCLMLGGSLDERRVGGEWIHVYVWLSPFAIHLKLSQHC